MATLAPEAAVTRAIDSLDVSRAELYRDDVWLAPFKRLRAEAPVHKVEHSDYGAYWSVSSYKPIVEIESLPDLYSSERGGITIADAVLDSDIRMPMFIARDRPVHTGQRRTVAPAFTPSEMTRMSVDIRRRTGELLDSLPWNKEFDWVDAVSIELTTQMLAILFDFPWARPAQADLLVRLGGRYRNRQKRGAAEAAPRLYVRMRRLFSELVESEGRPAADPRPDLHDDPFGRDGAHGSFRIYR